MSEQIVVEKVRQIERTTKNFLEAVGKLPTDQPESIRWRVVAPLFESYMNMVYEALGRS